MEKIKIVKSQATIDLNIRVVLSEQEARALYQIVKYSTDTYLKVFYEKMGSSYVKPYEGGVRSLFETMRKELPNHLKYFDEIQKLVAEINSKKPTT